MMNNSTPGSTALCVLGVHRSGTSTVTRALNLLGAYLGEEAELMPATAANPEGYWERMDIWELQESVLTQLHRSWDTACPLPDQWHLAPNLQPCREQLKNLVASKLAAHPLWAWKDPRTCLLLPLWRGVLDELGVGLRCVFVVRSPLDVARSLHQRDAIPLSKAFGIWFSYSVSALHSAAGLPTALIGYDRLLESWEPELRRATQALELPWPADGQKFSDAMNGFIRPGLRHSQSGAGQLEREGAPRPVCGLYALLLDAVQAGAAPGASFHPSISQFAGELRDYASFFQSDVEHLFLARSRKHRRREAWRRVFKA